MESNSSLGRAWFLPCVLLLGLVSALALVALRTEASTAGSHSAVAPPGDHRSRALGETYDRWKNATHGDPSRYETTVGLAWFPGVSTVRSAARGLALVDMVEGTVTVELGGIENERLTDVWLIDNRPGRRASSMPDPADSSYFAGSLRLEGQIGTLKAEIGVELLRDFDIDRVVIALRDEGPIEGGVLFGSPTLFDRLYRASRRLEQGLAPVAGDETSRRGLLAGLPPPSARTPDSPEALRVLGTLVDEGEELFFNETFDGNGRTCGTCHPAENNFTLDKEFISSLPADDPLFVAEFVPDLNYELNGGLVFESPALMREFALIVENLDGFDDLAHNFVMRSPNHLFGLALTLGPPSGVPCETVPPLDRLGWGGDGAPGSGTLREFATGAVIQHAPLTLARVEGADFRLPTDEELDALEAFQLSLGRQQDPDLRNTSFSDPNVIAGRDLFLDPEGGHCQACHEDGGALRRAGSGARNVNFDIGIFHVDHPPLPAGDEIIPVDDGFGTDHQQRRCFGTFSTPSLIEAADTPPFEHNNVFTTLEEAIAHYSTDEFNLDSTAGSSLPGIIDLTDEEVHQIGALLRVLNALQNIEDVHNCHERVHGTGDPTESERLLDLCLADNQDALEVLSEGPLAPLHPVAQGHLSTSLDLHAEALLAGSIPERNASLVAARAELRRARKDMLLDE